jgi:hypothetical protein
MTKREWRAFLFAFFWHGFLCGFTRRILLVLILVVVAAILFLNLGASMGLPVLFWHEQRWKQALAGWSVTVLVFVVLFVGFLLDHKTARCRQWVATLPKTTKRDLIAELKYYMIGGLFSLAVTGLFGGAVWGIGKGFQWLQRVVGPASELPPLIGRSATMVEAPGAPGAWKSLTTDPTMLVSWWPFYTGVLVAWAVLYAAGKFLAPRLRVAAGRRTPGDHEAVSAELAARLQWVAGLLFAALALNYLANALGLGFATPATALCSALGLIAFTYGFVIYREWNRALIALALFLLLMLGGVPQYKLRVPGLDAYYENGRLVTQFPSTQPVERARDSQRMQTRRMRDEPAPAGLIRTEEIAWTAAGEPRRPLVLVCVSGGGIRASVWSAAVLSELERRVDDFPYHVRMISGASGGMVGAGYYVSSLLPPQRLGGPGPRHALIKGRTEDRDALETLVRNLAEDSLSVSVKQMIFHDAWWTLLPFSNSHDRGRALEAQWSTYWDAYIDPKLTGGTRVGDMTFGRLRAGERAGWRPSLVYSPMMVEDGRRVLITNLQLAALTQDVGASLVLKDDRVSPDEPVQPYEFYSRSGAQLALMFPGAFDDFRVVTAARLSASFPYVSPAAVLPTRPRRRVVDAGYYDNYGVTVAAGWLADCLTGEDGVKLEWLKRHVSGVLVLQVRDGVNKLTDLDSQIGEAGSSPGGRGFEWASTPVEGVLSARDSVSVFRNDSSLQKVSELFRIVGPREGFDPDYFATVAIEFDGSAPLSWYLTTQETDGMINALSPGKDTRAAKEIDLVKQWFDSRNKPRSGDKK